MRFMGAAQAGRFDRFKDQIFHKKKTQMKQKYRAQNKTNPINPPQQFHPTKSPFLRKFIFTSIFLTGVYFANQKFGLGHRLVSYFDTYAFHPIQKITIYALGSDLIRRLSINPQHHTLNQNINSYFPNVYFNSELNLLLSNLTIQNNPKMLSQQINSRFSFGPFRFGNRCDKLFINKNGHVIRQSKKSKVNIGGINFVGSKIQQIIEFQRTVTAFDGQIDIQKSCKTINMINKLFIQTQEYDKIYTQCVQNNSQLYRKIIQKVRKQKAKAQNNNKLNKFIIST